MDGRLWDEAYRETMVMYGVVNGSWELCMESSWPRRVSHLFNPYLLVLKCFWWRRRSL